MAEVMTTEKNGDGRRLIPSTAGEFVSRGGRWVPAMTPKMSWTVETVDPDTGEQRMVGKQLLDASGNPVFEANPAAERMIRTNYADLGYMPTADFPEPKQDRRVQELEATVSRLESILLGKVKVEDLPTVTAAAPKPATREDLLAIAKRDQEEKSQVSVVEVSSGNPGSMSRTRTVAVSKTI